MSNSLVRRWLSLAYCLLAAWSVPGQAAEVAYPLAVSIYEDIYADYRQFVRGRDLASIDYYGGSGARRDVIEVVLLQQALQLGGFKESLELRDEQNYLRTLRQIADGELISSGALVWYSDVLNLPDLFHITQPVIDEGEFVVGLYTSPENQKALAAKTLEDLRQLRAVSSIQWYADVATLKNLDIHHLYFTTDWIHMVRMVSAGRADFTLAPFQPSAGMKIVLDDMELIPIEGIKVAINGTRHWPVSRRHPRGQEYYEALQKGITLMKERGIIQQAYEESGFFHPEVDDWRLLNPPSKSAPQEEPATPIPSSAEGAAVTPPTN